MKNARKNSDIRDKNSELKRHIFNNLNETVLPVEIKASSILIDKGWDIRSMWIPSAREDHQS